VSARYLGSLIKRALALGLSLRMRTALPVGYIPKEGKKLVKSFGRSQEQVSSNMVNHGNLRITEIARDQIHFGIKKVVIVCECESRESEIHVIRERV
jgi:hypothetical protein